MDEEREMIICSAVCTFMNDHTYTQKSFIEETLSEQTLECTRVEHPDADSFAVLQSTLSQSERAIAQDCCIPGMAALKQQLIIIYCCTVIQYISRWTTWIPTRCYHSSHQLFCKCQTKLSISLNFLQS